MSCVRRRTLRVLAFGTSLSGLMAAVAVAQPTVRQVKHRVVCTTCRVEFTKVATVGHASDPVHIADFSGLARDSRGRFFAFGRDLQLIAYDTNGRFVKSVGRRGEGPGEFSGIGGFAFIPPHIRIGRGDSLFVFDNKRISVFTPQLTYVRTISLPFIPDLQGMYPLQDGSWLIGGTLRTPGRVGYSTHVLDPQGVIHRSFGPEDAVREGSPPSTRTFHLSPANGSIWYAGGYRLEQWDVSGRYLGGVDLVDVPFLPKPSYTTRVGRSGTPVRVAVGGGSINFTGIDNLGRLWMSGRPPGAHVQWDGPGSPPPIVPGILEVVDPRTGDILVSQKIERPAGLFPSGAFAFSLRTDANDIVSFDILSFRIVQN